MTPHNGENEDEQDVTAKYLGKKMHELPEDLQRQILELEVTTDRERLADLIWRNRKEKSGETEKEI